jgi:hypothetical protein
MKKLCKNCQYFRAPGQMDAGIAGVGHWCSNSQSSFFRLRVEGAGTCDQFQAGGRKAGFWLRLKVRGLGWVNKILRRKK